MPPARNTGMWSGRRVLVTGHTGFKGSWLALWLAQMGAKVTGLSLPAEEVSVFRQARLDQMLRHIEGDIRDAAVVEATIAATDPEVVFHLAAQPLVRRSYEIPVETFATNVQGTVHVLDACRRAPSLRAVVCITSDKAYENREWAWPYRECDAMGGHDPYSASKGAAELVIAAYRRSFFSRTGMPMVASVRAGNVIGGGDWALDRLIPDIVRALIAEQRPVIRNPAAIRPWQHVLEALGGYLEIAGQLYAGRDFAADAWNFGPGSGDTRRVGWIADRLVAQWYGHSVPGMGEDRGWDCPAATDGLLHEANTLKLDCSKAQTLLGWQPRLALAEALEWIVAWHRRQSRGDDARELMLAQIFNYSARETAA